MLEVTLFSKESCHLCEEARELLRQLSIRYPHRLNEIFITSNRELLQKYGQKVPVVRVGDEELSAPLGMEELEGLLRGRGE